MNLLKTNLLCLLIVFSSGISIATYAQNNIAVNDGWISLNTGQALYFDTVNLEWTPVKDRIKIPLKTYLLTKELTESELYIETNVFELPPDSYFYIEDVSPRGKTDLVRSLSQIEAEQLPVERSENQEASIKLGVTYGNQYNEDVKSNIPHLKERFSAINWFYDNNFKSAALLSLKRTLTQFPVLYLNKDNFDMLCLLYNDFELYGFIFEESQKVLQMESSQELINMANSWVEKTRERFN